MPVKLLSDSQTHKEFWVCIMLQYMGRHNSIGLAQTDANRRIFAVGHDYGLCGGIALAPPFMPVENNHGQKRGQRISDPLSPHRTTFSYFFPGDKKDTKHKYPGPNINAHHYLDPCFSPSCISISNLHAWSSLVFAAVRQ
jgi:hypothetical protein